jgi:hypothetical protein
VGDRPLPEELTEAEFALFGLVDTLENDNYSTVLGVSATTTPAFIDAKTLVCLLVLLDRTPRPRY